jgi:hypothetical protein
MRGVAPKQGTVTVHFFDSYRIDPINPSGTACIGNIISISV